MMPTQRALLASASRSTTPSSARWWSVTTTSVVSSRPPSRSLITSKPPPRAPSASAGSGSTSTTRYPASPAKCSRKLATGEANAATRVRSVNGAGPWPWATAHAALSGTSVILPSLPRSAMLWPRRPGQVPDRAGDHDQKGQDPMQLSARNQIRATVGSITTGEAIANVELNANGVRLVASITVEAVRQLGLAEGRDVIAVIKASDVIVAIPD